MAVIAIVDDEAPLIELMSELLADEGHKTISHNVGNTAYAMIKAKQPDLVVLDIRLETPDAGWVILDRLRLDPQTSRIPVVICSADTSLLRAKEDHFREKGCCVLEKPFSLDELLAVVAEALDPIIKACGPA